MKYRHIYHAGNFADVHKHVTLLALLRSLARKEKGFLFLDTHAGRGLYDLSSSEARKSEESNTGIIKIISALTPPSTDSISTVNSSTLPEEIKNYLTVVRNTRKESHSRNAYPGSPIFVLQSMRNQDRAVFIESQHIEHKALLETVRKQPHVTVECADGYERLKTWLPPLERRALVLIDPPYEDSQVDFKKTIVASAEILGRLPNAIIVLWFPIKHERDSQYWINQLANTIAKPLLVSELWRHPRDNRVGLNGGGLIIINPPFQFSDRMRVWLPILHAALDPSPSQGGYEVRLLGVR